MYCRYIGMFLRVLRIFPPTVAAALSMLFAVEVFANSEIEKIEQMFDALAVSDLEIPQENFSILALSQKLGDNPQEIRRWVEDNIELVPYRGLLRGAQGTLLDGTGNSLDRALLVHALLENAGRTVRLARGKLSEEQAKFLFDSLIRSKLSRREKTSRPTLHSAKKYLKTQPYADQELLNELEQSFLAWTALEARIRNRVSLQTRKITEAVESYFQPVAYRSERDSLKMLQDHWWVQVKAKQDWVDLDPSATGQDPRRLVSPIETLSPDAIGEELRHKIVLEVTIEQWDGSELNEKALMSYTFHPYEIIGQSLFFTNTPVDDIGMLDRANDLSGDQIGQIVADVEQWAAVLSIGRDLVGTPAIFTVAGEIGIKTGLPFIDKSATDALDLFGSLPSGNEFDADKPQDKTLTAQWVKYRIQRPGEADKIAKRAIVDLVGPAQRALIERGNVIFHGRSRESLGLGLLREVEILPQVTRFRSGFLAHLTARRLLANRGQFMQTTRRMSGIPYAGLPDHADDQFDRPPSQLYALALLRDDWRSENYPNYLSSTNILAMSVGVVRGPNGGTLHRRDFDLIVNDISSVGEGKAARYARLYQGILDTNIEAALLAPARVGTNSADFLEYSEQAGTQWTIVKEIPELDDLEIDLRQDLRHRITQDLIAGNLVMLPASSRNLSVSGDFPYWRIDPISGQTVGINGEGLGGAIDEYIIAKFNIARETYAAWRSFTCVVLTTGSVALKLLSSTPENSDEVAASLTVTALALPACLISRSLLIHPQGTYLAQVANVIGLYPVSITVMNIGGWIYRYFTPWTSPDHPVDPGRQ